jgi:hypothetical protein
MKIGNKYGNIIITHDYQSSRTEFVSVQLRTDDAEEIISALDAEFGASNYNARWTMHLLEEFWAKQPPITEDRKYIAVVRGSYSAVYSTKGASARNNQYSGGGYNEGVYRYLCLEGTTGYYSPFETYAIVSIVEIDDEIARKENLKPMPTPKRGIEIMELMPEAKGILSEEKYYLSIN